MKPVIVIFGHTAGLAVARGLATHGVSVVMVDYDARGFAGVSRHVAQRVRSPHPEHTESEFIEFLLGKGDAWNGGLLVPASDEALVAVARHKARLEDSFVVACPDWPVVQNVIEKRYTYAVADSVGVPVPKTIVPNSVSDVEEFARTTGFPCLVKPSQSHLFYERFGTKMFPAADTEQLLELYEKAAAAGREVLLQEFIPGDEDSGANYNSYRSQGEALVEFTARKVRSAPPTYGSPRVVVSEVIRECEEPGRKVLNALGVDGYSCTEFKRDARDGTYKLIEVNARHNLSSMLALRCGCNFPWIQYRHLMLGQVPGRQDDYTTGMYWIDIPRDVGYSVKYFRREKLSLAGFLRPYFRPHVFAILDRKDMRPFVKRVMLLHGQFWSVVLNKITGPVRWLRRRMTPAGPETPDLQPVPCQEHSPISTETL